MPRPTKGPRLWSQPARYDENGKLNTQAVWVIRDGAKKISTGIRAIDSGTPPAEAHEALGRYLIERHNPAAKRDRDAASCPIADVIALYLRDKAEQQARPSEVAGRAKRLLEFWGEKALSDVTGASCRAYVEHRNGAAVSRRELEDFRAAIVYHRKEGYCREIIEVTLPEKGDARTEWLTRQEVAKLVWAAWRYQEPIYPFKKSRQHVARFALISLYAGGTRAGAVCGAALYPTIGHGWIDTDRGVFFRRPEGERETKKRKPPVRIPARLLAHLRRWKKNGQRFAVEFNGKPILDVDKAFRNSVRAAGLRDGVSPHTLRHTAATWLMQAGADKWEASGFLGMTFETLERVYGHHHPDFQTDVADKITRKKA